MTVEIRVDVDQRLRVSILSGTITDAELLEAYEAMLADPAFDPTLHDLVDACSVVRVAATPDGIRKVAQAIARMDDRYGPNRVALVAPGGPAHVMAKLYTFYRDAQGSPLHHRVFRSLREAREWLEEEGSDAAPGEA
jgi:hypothetical protein